MASSSSLAAGLALLALTYLAHSTLLLVAAWLAIRLGRVRSHLLTERIWKLAAAIGLASAPLQLGLGFSRPLAEFTIGSADDSMAAAGDALGADASRTSRAAMAPGARWRISVGETPTLLAGDAPAASTPVGEPIVSKALSADAEATTGNGLRSAVRSATSTDRAAAISPIAGSKRLAAPMGLLFAAWIALGAVWLAIQAWRLHRFLLRCPLLECGPARCALDQLLQRAGLRRRVRLLVSAEYSSPVACGLWRWTIVLPEKTEKRLRSDELDALLAHELAHLVRGDVVWLWIGRTLATCFAFQPLNRLACRGWQRAAEYLCDDWAAERIESPLNLARCLTQVASWRHCQRQPVAALAAGGSPGTLVERVERLVARNYGRDPWSAKFRRRGITLAAALMALSVAAWAPRAVCSPRRADHAPSGARQRDGASRQPRAESAARQELRAEWSGLQADWSRAEALLAPLGDQREIHRAADQIRQRATTMGKRLDRITAGFRAQVSFEEE